MSMMSRVVVTWSIAALLGLGIGELPARAEEKGVCKWIGTAPFCFGQCPAGWSEVRKSAAATTGGSWVRANRRTQLEPVHDRAKGLMFVQTAEGRRREAEAMIPSRPVRIVQPAPEVATAIDITRT